MRLAELDYGRIYSAATMIRASHTLRAFNLCNLPPGFCKFGFQLVHTHLVKGAHRYILALDPMTGQLADVFNGLVGRRQLPPLFPGAIQRVGVQSHR